jgi:hypothetical protein
LSQHDIIHTNTALISELELKKGQDTDPDCLNRSLTSSCWPPSTGYVSPNSSFCHPILGGIFCLLVVAPVGYVI